MSIFDRTNAALAAYAAPIQAHARKWARGVLDSIECDLATVPGTRFEVELAEVCASREWQDAICFRPMVPDGAQPWARDVWQAAFAEELAERVSVRASLRGAA